VARSVLSYQSRTVGKDAPVIELTKELSAQYPRYGYRRIRIFLGRGGYSMSPGRAYRLWRAAGLQLPRKRPRKRAAAARPRRKRRAARNQVWFYDFVFDGCANDQQLKCLPTSSPRRDFDGRIRSPRVIEVLARLVGERGAPAFLRSDNGPDLVLYRRTRDQHRVDRARQALAECRHEKLQRQVVKNR
jgi:putative transposase